MADYNSGRCSRCGFNDFYKVPIQRYVGQAAGGYSTSSLYSPRSLNGSYNAPSSPTKYASAK